MKVVIQCGMTSQKLWVQIRTISLLACTLSQRNDFFSSSKPFNLHFQHIHSSVQVHALSFFLLAMLSYLKKVIQLCNGHRKERFWMPQLCGPVFEFWNKSNRCLFLKIVVCHILLVATYVDRYSLLRKLIAFHNPPHALWMILWCTLWFTLPIALYGCELVWYVNRGLCETW